MNNFVPDFLEVLTSEGWVELKHYNKTNKILLLNHNYKTGYLKPELVSLYPYKGVLLEVETDSCMVYLKPSSQLLCDDEIKKAKDLKKGDLINKRFMWNKIEKISEGEWQGTLINLFFGMNLLMPTRFENDYWLSIV